MFTAITYVVSDVRESYPEMSVNEALAHVHNTVSLVPAIGATVLEDDGTDLALAYRLVIERVG